MDINSSLLHTSTCYYWSFHTASFENFKCNKSLFQTATFNHHSWQQFQSTQSMPPRSSPQQQEKRQSWPWWPQGGWPLTISQPHKTPCTHHSMKGRLQSANDELIQLDTPRVDLPLRSGLCWLGLGLIPTAGVISRLVIFHLLLHEGQLKQLPLHIHQLLLKGLAQGFTWNNPIPSFSLGD